MSLIELSTSIEDMKEYEPLPDGTYRAELQDVSLKANETTPQGFLTCQYRISPDQYPADYDAGNAPEGVTVTQGYIALPDASNRRTVAPFKRFLEALGAKVEGSQFSIDDLIGNEVQVTITRGEYNGSLVNNIKYVGPVAVV